MATNRTRKEMLAIWADAAVDLPGSPVIGTTYGRSTITDVLIKAAWAFNTTVESATFNEVMRRITFLLSQLEDQGILSWSSAITYAIGAQIMGDDGLVYVSLQNANLNKEPTVETAYWSKLVNMSQLGSSLDTSGYQILPTGLIIQWGVTFVPGNGVATAATLPVAWTDKFYQGVGTASSVPFQDMGIGLQANATTPTTKITLTNCSSTGSQNIRWIVLGR